MESQGTTLFGILTISVSELLTALLVGITAFYAWATFRILQANEKIVQVAREQMEDLTRPYIILRTFTVPNNTIIFLQIENIGKTPAYKLSLELDKDFYQFGEKRKGGNLRELEVFSNDIECFAPGTMLPFYLGTGPQLFGKDADQNVTPLAFSITANYKVGEKTITEKSMIDLRMHLHSAMAPDAIVRELDKISEAIEKLPDELGRKLKS
jgi:hypothetical protein